MPYRVMECVFFLLIRFLSGMDILIRKARLKGWKFDITYAYFSRLQENVGNKNDFQVKSRRLLSKITSKYLYRTVAWFFCLTLISERYNIDQFYCFKTPFGSGNKAHSYCVIYLSLLEEITLCLFMFLVTKVRIPTP